MLKSYGCRGPTGFKYQPHFGFVLGLGLGVWGLKGLGTRA